jgi:UDP-N-acetyl-2-amino-2-deoxyglucuronate dehydrogenase
MNKKFAITGVAGYIAPRHLKAIFDTGNTLVAALDPHDAVGILDRYFPECDFFTEPERFDRHLEKLKRLTGSGIDFMSICSPNYLHDAHIRMALRAGADAICEKPLVLNPKNLDLLHEIESETGKRIYTVLQLRLHDAIKNLKSITYSLQSKANVDLTYITSRGKWYNYSWKGNEERSGGILSNIGIHFFDMLIWIFGKVVSNKVISRTNLSVTGELELERAFVKWKLSIDGKELPKIAVEKAQKTFRSISINGAELEFSEGFTDLHTVVYKDILNGGGYGIEDTRGAIELVYSMR